MKRRWLMTLLILPLSTEASALVVDITYADGASEGFNDSTFGAARRAAFERALEIWTTQLDGAIALKIDARFDDLGNPGPLGQASTVSYSANLPGLGNLVWYSSALASQLNGTSRPSIDENFHEGSHMYAQFNSDIDQNAVGAGRWYYGLDGSPPGADEDFVTIALHELGHAFGFGPLN